MYRLSDYYGNKWKKHTNTRGLSPSVDFAHTRKFKINTDFHRNIKDLYEQYKDTAIMGKRSLTIRNIPDINNYLRYKSNITNYINSEVADLDVPFILHPMISDAYMFNLTPEKQVQKNIDNWHYDYMPFVFVYMVKKTDINSGRLILKLNDEKKTINLQEGEGIFMQGSQIEHLAQRCENGDRVTLVLSFIPKDIMIRDNTYIIKGMQPYHPNENLHEQYLEYKNKRIIELIKKQKKITRALLNEWNDIAKSYELF